MLEERDGMQCNFAFGKDSLDAIKDAQGRCAVDATQTYRRLNNPLPTGDHWKLIGWVLEYIKKGQSSLMKISASRREFIKHAAEEVGSGRGFCLELGSMAARKFRDQSDLRMQRGKVFILVNKAPVRVEEIQEVVVNEI